MVMIEMTTEEAKEILKRVEIAKPIKFEDYADMREALDMAIKALESHQRIRKIIDDFDKKHPEDIITPVHQYINDLCDVLEDIEYQIPNKAESEDKKDIERQMWDDFHELTTKYYYYINAYEDMNEAGLPPCFTPRIDAKYIKCIADGIEQALGAIVKATKDLTERSGIDGEQRGQG